MSRILVTGAANGLGREIANALRKAGHSVIPFDIENGRDVRAPRETFVARASTDCPPIDVLINCAGVNLTGWLEDLTAETWDVVLDVNARGILKMVQWALPALIASRGTVLNIVSNASHMPMTCSVAYNASKGAAHIMTLQMARELTRRHGITVFGISPNKLRGTAMSKAIEQQVMRDRGWTAEYARQYQLNSLLAGEETDPVALAEFVAFLLQDKQRHKYLTGCVLPYGA